MTRIKPLARYNSQKRILLVTVLVAISSDGVVVVITVSPPMNKNRRVSITTEPTKYINTLAFMFISPLNEKI